MSDNNLKLFKYIKKENPEIQEIGKSLGKGGFGVVRKIIVNQKKWAGKLIEKKKNEKTEEEKYGIILRGKNIININKIISCKIGMNNYELIIMEKSLFGDLGKLIDSFYNKNSLKIIYNPFDETFGNNLLRFFTKQIINALEMLNRNYYVHNDIKPENVLISKHLVAKLTDFGLLRKVKDKKTKIPGGTHGYLSPEYYINKEVDDEVARKQDYFALGSTLYFLKYGKQMLKFNNYNENRTLNADEIVKLLEQNRDNIKSQKMSDGDFINFLSSLIEYKPEDRPVFEEIYRNIWLNKNSEQINNINSINLGDETKLLMELQKSDFLIKKEKEFENYLNLKNVDYSIKKERNKLCKFKFKKKIKK